MYFINIVNLLDYFCFRGLKTPVPLGACMIVREVRRMADSVGRMGDYAENAPY
jgi:hypothetical protein